MPGTMVTKAQMIRDLQRLGLEQADTVIVHSALSSLGRVAGGAAAVVEALLEVLGPEGTLLMPTFAGPQPFRSDSASGLGAVTEALRKHPEAQRSFHPTHSIAAVGPRAEELLQGHLASPTATGAETPYGRLIDTGGKILLLGVDQDRNTCLHALEERVGAAYLSDYATSYVDEEGREQTVTLHQFPGPHRDFISLDPLLTRKGAQVVGKVGDAIARLVHAGRMRDVVLDAFEDDPALVLCDNPECADCIMQRRRIWRERLEHETFTLSALASSISPWPDEVAAECARAGVYDLVIDRLHDLPVWRVEPLRLSRAMSAFRDEGISVGAIYAPSEPEQLADCARLAGAMSTSSLILAMPPSPQRLVEASEQEGVQVFFENGRQTSAMCARLLSEVETARPLCFNPAAFAMMGEKPFLQSYTQTPLRHRIGMLMLSDATFGGSHTPPARGNGEVKELLSILRCKSFRGRVVLGTGPGGPAFRDIVGAFRGMMSSM